MNYKNLSAINILDFFYDEENMDQYLIDTGYTIEDLSFEGYEDFEILGVFIAKPEVYDILEENNYEEVYYIHAPDGYVFIGLLANRRIFDVTYSICAILNEEGLL